MLDIFRQFFFLKWSGNVSVFFSGRTYLLCEKSNPIISIEKKGLALLIIDVVDKTCLVNRRGWVQSQLRYGLLKKKRVQLMWISIDWLWSLISWWVDIPTLQWAHRRQHQNLVGTWVSRTALFQAYLRNLWNDNLWVILSYTCWQRHHRLLTNKSKLLNNLIVEHQDAGGGRSRSFSDQCILLCEQLTEVLNSNTHVRAGQVF